MRVGTGQTAGSGPPQSISPGTRTPTPNRETTYHDRHEHAAQTGSCRKEFWASGNLTPAQNPPTSSLGFADHYRFTMVSHHSTYA